MIVNFYAAGYYEIKPTFAANNPKGRVHHCLEFYGENPPFGGSKSWAYTTTLLQFSCAQQFLVNTIYSILPNFSRQTLAAVAGVKMGLLQGWFFSISKTVFAANLYNFRLSQKLASNKLF